MSDRSFTPPIYRSLTIGVVGVLAVAIAPILLTRLYETERISAEGIGIAICIEFIAMALGSILGPKLLGGAGMAMRLSVICVAMAAANAWTPYAEGSMILLSRALAGFFGGAMIWVVITTIIRMPLPEKWSGIYLSGHTAIQFATATIIAAMIVPAYGASGGYLLLAAVSLALIPVALSMPDIPKLADVPGGETDVRVPFNGWVMLASIMLLTGMFSTLISYAEVEFQARGFPVEETLLIVPVILLAQIVGGLLASLLAPRINQTMSIIAVSAVLAAVTWWLSTPLSIVQVYIGFAIFGFCWLFIGPFHLGVLLRKIDAPQTAELVAAAGLFGLAFGPLVGAALLGEGGYPPAAYNLALIAGSVLLLLAAVSLGRKVMAPAT